MTVVRHGHFGGPFRVGPPGFGANGGHPFLGLLFVVIILALVVWALVLLTRHVNRRYLHRPDQGDAATGTGTSDALKILNERFARGEIGADEFTQRRDLLLQPR
jgi:putative membrane protein